MNKTITAGVGMLALMLGACVPAPDAGVPLSAMADKKLSLSLVSFSSYETSLSLESEGCRPLVPGTVQATLNGRPMTVDPGWHGRDFSDREVCQRPYFTFTEPLRGLGPTLTYVIQDASQTLRLVVDNVRTDLPIFQPQTATPPVIRQGEKLAFGVSSLVDPPRRIWVRVSGYKWGEPVAPCGFEEEAKDATLDGSNVTFTVPTVCHGPGGVTICLEYSETPSVTSCEGAACIYQDPIPAQTCQHYDIEIVP